MALENFIATIWSARLLENLRKTLVYGQLGVINKDYEGEVSSKGSTVKINSIGAVTIGDYTKNTDITAPETLSDAQASLVIDQAKYFNFQVDDIDKAQQNPKIMDSAMAEAAYGLSNVADQHIAGLYTCVAASNTIGNDTTPVVPTKSDAYEYLVDLSIKLDEANVPATGRWAVVPPWFHGLMLKDDRFVKAENYGSTIVLQNAEVGKAAGFTILKSNNVPNIAGAKYKIIAGSPIAITFAEQINETEAYRPEKRFADAVKGLHLYGAKLIRNTAIAVLTANKS